VNEQQEGHQGPQAPAAAAVDRPRRAAVDPDPDGEDRGLDRHGGCERLPQPHADEGRGSGVDRQIGLVHDGIEAPVAQHQHAEHDGGATVTAQAEVDQPEEHGPCRGRQQAVRQRIVLERQRGDDGLARDDAHALDAKQQQAGPEQIEELRGDEQPAERHLRRHALGGETESEVTDEHAVSPPRRALSLAPVLPSSGAGSDGRSRRRRQGQTTAWLRRINSAAVAAR